MSMFRKLVAYLGYNATPVVFDDALAVPHVVRAREAAVAGRFDAWSRAVQNAPTAATGEAAVWILGDRRVATDTISSWAETQGEEPLALLAWGVRLIADGWAIRSGAYAQDVSRDQALGFVQHLQRAEHHLGIAAQRLPGSPLPWSALLTSGRGLDAGEAELARRYDAAMARGGEALYRVHEQRLQSLTAKWGGSHDAMFTFARSLVRAPEEASPRNAILASAHVERWLAEQDGWLEQAHVRKELRHAASAAWAPGFPDDSAGLVAHNVFAFALRQAGLPEESMRHVVHLRDRFQQLPWAYMQNPAQEVGRAQRAAIIAGLL